MYRKLLLLPAVLLTQLTSQAQDTWTQRSDLGAGGRAQSFSFEANGIGYVGGGFLDAITPATDVWAYDPLIDAWSQVADFGGGARSAAAAFSINAIGYVCAGVGSGGEVNDLWAYDPILNTWASRAGLPGAARRRPIAFVLNGSGFIGTGLAGPTVLDDLWAYDPGSDTWTARANVPIARWLAASFAINGFGYVFGGTDATFTYLSDLQAYDPTTDTWTARAPYPGPPRSGSVGFALGLGGYITGGFDTVGRLDDCFEYRPGTNNWVQVASPGPQGRSSACAFTLASNAYVIGGFLTIAGNDVITDDVRMYTQNPQPDCMGVPGGPALPGTPCDDLNSATVGDVFNGLCQCAGTCTNDADGDGICDENDGCPNTPGYEGLPCNDSDPCTTGDVINGSCQCVGTYQDSDNDGLCDAQDNCPSLSGEQGATCDDSNANTTNDVITSACVCMGIPVSTDTWTQRTDFSGFPRAHAVAFTIGNYGYFGTGQSVFGYEKDLWRYDQSNDSWSQMADVDLSGRTGAFAFAIGDYGYVGGGLDDVAPFNSDLRRYDPVANEWTVMIASHPSGFGRVHAAAFSANGKGYMGTGQTLNGYAQDFWEYDPTSNSWSQLSDYPGGQRWASCAFAIGSTGYVGTGLTNIGFPTNDFYEFDALAHTWSPISNFSGAERAHAVGFSLSGKGYVGTGADATEFSQDFWKYDSSTDTWTSSTALPGPGRWGATAFVVNGNSYVATGIGSSGSLGDVWEYSPGDVPCTVGQPCDDGNPCTTNDQLDMNCTCVGSPSNDGDLDGICDALDDCPTIPGLIGSSCDDGDACTLNDVLDANCQCIGTPLICDDGNVCNGVETCVAGVCVPGIALNCDDGNPCTINSCDPLLGCTQLNVPDGTSCGANTQCLSGVCTPIIACDNWTLEFTTDNAGGESTWQIINANTLAVLGSGGPYASNTTITASICLPPGACYRLRVTDANGMSNGTTGGFVLRDNTGKRVLDNASDGVFTGTSQAVAPFCSPVGNDGLIASQCDKLDWSPGGLLIASPNSAVSAQYGVGNQSDDGYEFRIFNPDGGYDRTVFISHANPVPGAATGATAACYLGFSSLQTNPVPQNVLLNVRVRSAVNGVYSAWGPACRFKIDAASANCPTTKLITTPGSTFSCGATGKVVNASGAAGRIYAQPVTRPVGGVNQAANAYLFELTNTANNYVRVIGTPSYTLVLGKWYTDPLLCGTHTYNVRVRVSFDGGATYCSWGASCTVGITNNFTSPFCTTPAGNLCGNGVMNPGETCDDGNQVNGDGCDNNCQPTGSANAYSDDRVFFDGDETSTDAVLTLWPNPNNGEQLYVTINALNADVTTATVDIFDMVGHKVTTRTIAVNGTTLNTVIALDASMAHGMYLVNVTAGDQTFIQRLVIQ